MELAPLDRRRFLRVAAMTAAGVLVTSCANNTASTSSASGSAGSAAASSSAAPASSAAQTSAATTSAAAAQATTASASSQAITLANAQTSASSAASASGKYKEAPQLADLVKAGKLPPVEQRLPANPRVIKPLQSVGEYGGTWHRAYQGLSDRWGPTKLIEEPLSRWEAPDTNTIQVVPGFAEKWDQNSDATEFTFHLRQGLKWSDGQPVTTDDAKFWWEDVQQNKDLVPAPSFVVSQSVKGKTVLASVDFPDQNTIHVKYPQPYPLLPILMAKLGGAGPGQPAFIVPAHYLKQFTPKYGDQTKIDALVKQKGLKTWTDLWGNAGDMQGPIAFWFLNPDLPVINAWKIQTPPPSDPMVMVRNPYYYGVDPDGNQLPYIDQINHNLYQDQQVLNLWIASGKIDCQGRGLSAGDYTFYKQNEQKGGYTTVNWRAASTNCYYVSLNAPDPVLAKLFDTPDFRQALNLAINREEINQLVYNGLGTARQYSPVKGSPEFDQGMTDAWAQFDLAKANSLLDGLGLKKGADGVRLRPDGKPLEIVMEHTAIQGSPDLESHNLIVKYWAAIGVKVDLKYDERALYEQRVMDAVVTATGGFAWDRSSVVKADPGRFLGTIPDGPWAPAYGQWYAKAPYKQIQPPADHPINKIWSLWDQTQVEPDEAKRNALFQQLIGVHKATPFAMGTVGELVSPFVVRANFHNFAGGYIQDDTLRDDGLINPPTFYMK